MFLVRMETDPFPFILSPTPFPVHHSFIQELPPWKSEDGWLALGRSLRQPWDQGMPPVSPGGSSLPRVLVSHLLPPILTTSRPGTTLCFSLFYFTPQSCWACVTWGPLASEFWVELAKGRHWKEIGGQEGGTDGAPCPPPNPRRLCMAMDPGGQPLCGW